MSFFCQSPVSRKIKQTLLHLHKHVFYDKSINEAWRKCSRIVWKKKTNKGIFFKAHLVKFCLLNTLNCLNSKKIFVNILFVPFKNKSWEMHIFLLCLRFLNNRKSFFFMCECLRILRKCVWVGFIYTVNRFRLLFLGNLCETI